ncbi:serine hydrolase domain-containing protein [Permianibacter aggregans]|uniref:CubicO group peptidase (Beta-lactamase class C family) n=1 Tax=Permianibacter aggregans TaxID=1510150 RepID=A0A4R6UTG0_9GAMM|nr:serine hydrolase domain-containing protein [Permianibacter aggregans]QGX40039.1 class A beta-lactamase-related serine hydrolase [Permianibacter aggregans]TDQ49149.1 CubicO group peptidase (beta-lactamase class C family) [Permianibacter aggregans]
MNERMIPLALFLSCVVSTTALAENKPDKTQHQKKLENHLLPAIIFADQPIHPWSIQQRMSRYRVPGVSIALINDGTVEWVNSYGSPSAKGDQALTPSARFQAASISKWVTAIGALKLVEQKSLKLEQSVNTYLKNWTLRNADGSANSDVTLKQLLSHQGGVSVRSFAGYAVDSTLPSARQILEGRAPANSAPIRVIHEPGIEYRYSGGGYQVTQQLIEEISGQSFARYMQENVLHAANMRHSSYQLSLQPQDGLPVACGHEFNGAPVPDCGRIYPELAAAWLWSTPSDLANLAIALIDSVKRKPNALLSSEMARAHLTPAIGNMGLGAGVHGEGQALHFDHSGWTHGFRSYLVVYPYLGKGIVVMANANGGHELISEVVRAAAATYQWPDFAPKERPLARLNTEQLDQFAGTYRVQPHGFNLQISRVADHLQVNTPRGSHYNYFPVSTNRFVAIEDGSELHFSSDREAGTQTLTIWQMNAVRLSEHEP